MVKQADVLSSAPAVATPAFLVGQDREGHWLAVETRGRGGGIFTNREAALHYALAETARRPGGIALAPEPIRLI